MQVNLNAAWESYRGGDLERAARVGEAVLAHDPNQSEALHLLGLVALRRGDPRRAAALFGEAAAVRPAEPRYHASLAEAWSALGQFDRAVDSCQAAYRLEPGRPEYHYNLGLSLMARGDLDAAISHLRGAIALKPDFSWAHINLGNALLRKGEKAAALDHFRQAVQLEATSAEAHNNLGSVLLNLGRLDEALSHCQQAARLRPDFAGAHNNLGHVLFALGRLDGAEACYRMAIRLQPDLVGAHAGLGRVLEELGDVDQAIAALREALKYLDRELIERIGRSHLTALATLNESADRIVDKLPENALVMGLLAVLFPHATMIHCRRDLRDVALSCWMTHFANLRWACDLHHIETRIREYKRLMHHWRAVLPVRILDVDYEALVADPERSSRELVAWCGLEWDPACREYYKNRRRVQTTSVAQVRQPIYHRSVGRWKNYEQALAAVFSQLAFDS